MPSLFAAFLQQTLGSLLPTRYSKFSRFAIARYRVPIEVSDEEELFVFFSVKTSLSRLPLRLFVDDRCTGSINFHYLRIREGFERSDGTERQCCGDQSCHWDRL
jgi:hypothetical protein